MIGLTISHYKILDKLGEGGMGVVYKAADTKLDRIVALKFLPAHVSTSVETKARFLQEAKAAAALNHPNICTIYGVEESSSTDIATAAKGQMYIVMEHVEGGTLREKLPFGKISDGLTLAIQIGEALQEAHAKGIVHRDIKADNIMLTARGQAKVMDFGLAKLKGSLKLTKTSSTVGTLGYMAPEQIQGGEVDHRSDIFSFGVLIFELFTGKLPFRGEHEAAMVYSIVNEAPDTLLKHRPDVPAELERIIARALEKDAEDRFQHADDLVSELRRVQKQSSKVSRAAVSSASVPASAASRTQTSAATEPAAPTGFKNNSVRIAIIAGFAVVALSAIAYTVLSSSLPQLNPNVTIRVLPIQFTQVAYPGFSRDGNWVAFPAADASNTWEVYFMHVSGNNSRRLTSDSTADGSNINADISPDGSLITYTTVDRTGSSYVKIVSSIGGPTTNLIKDGILPRWRPDGQRIGYIGEGKGIYNLWSMKPDGSDQRAEFEDTLAANGRFSYNWSPDGRSVAWIRSFQEGYQEIFTRELETGKELQLTNDKANADDVSWLSNGYIVFSSNRGGNTNLWIVPISGGAPQQLTKGSGPDIGISASQDNQKLVYLQQQLLGHIWDVNFVTNSSRQLTFDDRRIEGISLSPNGNRIAVVMADIDPLKPGRHLFLQDRDGSNRRQLTSGEQVAGNPAWSPDGKWITYSLRPATTNLDSAQIFLIEAENPGTPRRLGAGARTSWLDNKRLLARNLRIIPGGRTIYDEIVAIDDGSRKPFMGDSVASIVIASGNALVYLDERTATRGVWMVPLDYLANPAKYRPRRLQDVDGVVVARSQNYVYYVNDDNEFWRLGFADGRKTRVRGSFPGLDVNTFGSVSKDDSEFIYVSSRLSGKLVMMDGIFE